MKQRRCDKVDVDVDGEVFARCPSRAVHHWASRGRVRSYCAAHMSVASWPGVALTDDELDAFLVHSS